MDEIALEVKFGSTFFVVKLLPEHTVGELKAAVEERTSVPAEGQKLLGLPSAAAGNDAAELGSLNLKKPVQKLILMGTTSAALQREREIREAAMAEADEFVASAETETGEIPVHLHPKTLELVAHRVGTYKPKMVAGFRPRTEGQKPRTLVCDLDYTFLDHRSIAERPIDMMRPHLHEFLSSVYAAGWDIVIWSATGMSWIELKLRSFGCLVHPAYKIAALVDRGAMVTVDAPEYGGRVDIKPLPVLWDLFRPDMHPDTTVMIDDLRRNFLANPQQGLRIKACRDLPNTRHTDTELVFLARYFASIAELDSYADLNHRKWRKYLVKRGLMTQEEREEAEQ